MPTSAAYRIGRGLFIQAGAADKLDLRLLRTSDVYFDAFSADDNATNGNGSLKIVINNTTSVNVYGHFSPVSAGQQNGRMEQIIF